MVSTPGGATVLTGLDRLLVDSYGMPNTGSYKHWRE